MKRLILIPLLLLCVTAFGQFTKPELYTNINTNIRLKTYSPTRMASLLDSLVATMGTGGGSVVWDSITNTPTTIAGYGITDYNSLGDARWSPIALKTTLDAINGIIKSNGAGSYSAVTDNSTLWNNAISKTGTTAFTGDVTLEGADFNLNLNLTGTGNSAFYIRDFVSNITFASSYEFTQMFHPFTVPYTGNVGMFNDRANASINFGIRNGSFNWRGIEIRATSTDDANIVFTPKGGEFRIYNPANTFYYIIARGAIAANRTLTIPLLTGNDTFVTQDFTQTLTNKTLTSPVINTQISGTVTSGGNITTTNYLIGATATQTLTNKTFALGSNTLSGSLAEFNTALTGADFATGGGTATGTNTGDQTTITGNAGTATTLQTTRTIWGQNFNGSANVTGDLTLGNNSLLDGSGNEVVKLSGVGSAINEVTIQNAGASGYPAIFPTGGDTDIGLAIYGKGTSPVWITGSVLVGAGSYSSGTSPTVAINGNQISGAGTAVGGVSINGGGSLATSASTSGTVSIVSGAAAGTNTSSGSVTIGTQGPTGSGTEGAVEIQTRAAGKLGFFAATPVVKQAAVTTNQELVDALTAYGLIPSSTISGGSGLTYSQTKAIAMKIR